MTPPVAPKNQTPFDDEISLLDIIQFFKTNLKTILFFIVIGGILSGLYGKFSSPVYEGQMVLYPPKVAGKLIIEPTIIINKLNFEGYFSKEVYLACNPIAYRNRDYIYKLSDHVKFSMHKSNLYFLVSVANKSKETILDCLNTINHDYEKKEILSNKNLIGNIEASVETERKRLELNEKYIQEIYLKNNVQEKYLDKLIILSIESNNIKNQILKASNDLLPSQTNIIKREDLLINVKEKKLLSFQLIVFLGLSLGGILGVFICLCRDVFQRMKT